MPMKFNKKSIIDISIIILIAAIAMFFIWNVLVKDSNQSTKTKKSQISQDKILEIEAQQKIMPGINSITKEGQVIASTGKLARNDVLPRSPEAPQQSKPIKDLKQLPPQMIKLVVTEKGFTPSSFEVKAGEVVSLAVTSGDKWAHVFRFKDPVLLAVAVGVSEKETSAIVFNAPEKAGEYEFYCDIFGHENRGEKGKMIVK
jgi:plastocyanin